MPSPDVILTLNHRFVPVSNRASHGFGVVGFLTVLVRELSARGELAGIILYERVRGRSGGEPRADSFLESPACHLMLGEEMSLDARREALGRAIQMVRRSGARPTVIYHQTNTLLTATPDTMGAMVTHHAPFAAEVSRLFGEEIARDAFQGDNAKLPFLLASQGDALKYLRAHPNIVSLELSGVQERALLCAGVTQVERVAPPVVGGRDGRHGRGVWPVAAAATSLHVVSATARVDAFKNLDLLVSAVNALAARGVPVRLSLFVGTPDEGEARAALRTRLRCDVVVGATIRERLGHEELLCWLRERRGDAVFVCSSIYETLGITPLEAILSGMTTLTPDSEHVGVSEYVTADYRFEPSVEGLVDKLMAVLHRGHLEERGALQREHAARLTGVDQCIETVRRCAEHAHARSSGVVQGQEVDHTKRDSWHAAWLAEEPVIP